ncbi:hypothetical protein EK904_013724, partial [Melospiza melodia maxima]
MEYRCNWGVEPNCAMPAKSVCEQLFCVGNVNQGNHFHAEVMVVKNKMKELVSNSTTSISQARKAVEQLKMEAYMDRIKVSKAAADLLAYCDAHIGEDPLIIPVPASENPFREKKLF